MGASGTHQLLNLLGHRLPGDGVHVLLAEGPGAGGTGQVGGGASAVKGDWNASGGSSPTPNAEDSGIGGNPSPIEHKRWRRKVWCTHLLSEGSQKKVRHSKAINK